jgi:hypothetical protein
MDDILLGQKAHDIPKPERISGLGYSVDPGSSRAPQAARPPNVGRHCIGGQVGGPRGQALPVFSARIFARRKVGKPTKKCNLNNKKCYLCLEPEVLPMS